MSKVPVSASPHSKASTASSAWTRLVQNTKTASQTSRHSDAKSPGARTQFSPTSTASMAQLSRPAKRRRVTGPRKPLSAPTSTSNISGHDIDHKGALSRGSTIESAIESASTTRIRLCPEGEQPLPKRRCSLSPPSKRKSVSTGVPTASPTHTNLRTFWGPGAVKRQPHQDEPSQKGDDELEIGEAGKEGTAAKRSGNGNAPVLEVDENSEHDVENELPRQVPGRHVRDHAKRGVVQQNNAHVIDKTVTMTTRAESTENARATSDRSARLDSSSSSLHGRSRTRRRSKLEYDIGNKHEEQAMITGNSSDTATDLEAENAPAPPPTASAPGLHEDTIQQGLKRAPELATTSTISNSFTSSDEKENACPPARKAKRRLTLHDTQSQQQKTKKRKVAPRQTVQTTLALAIGGNAGMRECKVCDTVYNPFHPEDVKVHAKRHAGVVRKERRTVEL